MIERPSGHWKPAATTLERVVPVAQKRKASGLTVALSYLEVHEEGNGFLRFLMRQDRPTRWRALTMPRLEVRVRDGSGRPLDRERTAAEARGVRAMTPSKPTPRS